MAGSAVLRFVADNRLWLYGAGLAGLLAVRLGDLDAGVQTGLAGVLVSGLVLVYAAERVVAADEGVVRPLTLLVAVAGVGLGIALTLAGRPAGLAFLAGGLLFLVRAVPVGRGGE